MATHKPHVVVVGSSNTDMVIAGKTLPRPGQTLTNGAFYSAAGGKGANQAVAAARCGAKRARVSFVGAFGDDDFGRAAARGLLADGIDCRGSVSIKKTPSGVALIFVGGDGENMIAVAPGANDALQRSHIKAARSMIKNADVLLTQLETPPATVSEALSIARSCGVRTILNPAPAPAKRPPRSLLANVDILTPNETEFAAITGVEMKGARGEAAARRLARTVGEALIVTLGVKGVRVYSRDGEPYAVKAYKVKAIDAVAAGDAFSGSLALRLAEGAGLAEAIRFASAVAAISVTRRGAQPSLPSRREVNAFLKKGGR